MITRSRESQKSEHIGTRKRESRSSEVSHVKFEKHTLDIEEMEINNRRKRMRSEELYTEDESQAGTENELEFDSEGESQTNVKSEDERYKTALSDSEDEYERRKSTKFKCSDCSKVFKRKQQLQKHSETHLPESQRIIGQCTLCNKSFKTKAGLLRHTKTHSPKYEKNRFKCSLCDKSFSSKAAAKRHSQVHIPRSERGQLTCPICDKGFLHAASLNFHQRIHLSESEEFFSCDREFSNKKRFKDNEIIYVPEEEDKYFCFACELPYSSWNDLRLHKKEVHPLPPVVSPVVPKKPAVKKVVECKCSSCGEGATFKSVLRKRNPVDPSEMKRTWYKCTLCNKNCMNPRKLEYHKELDLPNYDLDVTISGTRRNLLFS